MTAPEPRVVELVTGACGDLAARQDELQANHGLVHYEQLA